MPSTRLSPRYCLHCMDCTHLHQHHRCTARHYTTYTRWNHLATLGPPDTPCSSPDPTLGCTAHYHTAYTTTSPSSWRTVPRCMRCKMSSPPIPQTGLLHMQRKAWHHRERSSRHCTQRTTTGSLPLSTARRDSSDTTAIPAQPSIGRCCSPSLHNDVRIHNSVHTITQSTTTTIED